MFADIQASAGGIDSLQHKRVPAPIDEQTVIRLNRDTLYSLRSWTWLNRSRSPSLMPTDATCRR